MRFPLFLEKRVVEDKYTNRTYKTFRCLTVVLGPFVLTGQSLRLSAEDPLILEMITFVSARELEMLAAPMPYLLSHALRYTHAS